jgi:hypothetical protein
MLDSKQATNTIFDYIGRFDLYFRWRVAKELKANTVYGEGDFGDKALLKQAKEAHSEDIKIDTIVGGPIHQAVIAHIGEGGFSDAEITSHGIEAVPTSRPRADFHNEDFIVDISPDKLFIIFPDLTFSVEISEIKNITWKEWRAYLEQESLLEGDMEGSNEELVTLDTLRKKMGDEQITELELKELRRKFYGFAYAVDKHIKSV